MSSNWLQVRLGCIRLSPSCPFRLLHTLLLSRPARHYPRFRIQRPSSERRGDFNPHDSCAAQRTIRASPSPHGARPVPRGRPVGLHCPRLGASRVAYAFLVYMLPPLPRCSGWTYSSLVHPSRITLPRKGCRVGLHIDLFEACSAFTRVAACTLALSPDRDTHTEGFSHFVTSIAAPVASGWNGCRVGLAPTGKRRLVTAHTHSGRSTHPR
jgi:hypothetical protein